MKRGVVLFCLVLILVCANVMAADYKTFYVDPVNGNDGDNGETKETAFKTIKVGIQKLKSFDQDFARELVLLKGEYKSTPLGSGKNYYENILGIGGLMGSPDNPVIIRGEGKLGDVKIYGYLEMDNPGFDPDKNPLSMVYSIVGGVNPMYVTLENLWLSGAGENVMNVEGQITEDKTPDKYSGERGAFYITFKDMYVENGGHYLGFWVGKNLHHFSFINVKFYGNLNKPYNGATHDNYWNAGTYGGPFSHDILIDGCEFVGARRWGWQANSAHLYNVVVRNSVFHHNNFGGLQFMNVHNLLIENNIFYNNNRQDIVVWVEEENYQKTIENHGPDAWNSVWDVKIKNNIFEGSPHRFWEDWWWSPCPQCTHCEPQTNKEACESQLGGNHCYWYTAEECDPDPKCYKGLAHWALSHAEDPLVHPRVKIVMDPPLVGVVDDFKDIVIENNVFAHYGNDAVSWTRTNPWCDDCEGNKIRNNLFYSNNLEENIGLILYQTKSNSEWFEIDEAQSKYPGLMQKNLVGDPDYFSVYNIPTIKGYGPKEPPHPDNIYDPEPDPNSWQNYPSLLPYYGYDSNDFHYGEDSMAIEVASSEYPEFDFDGAERPIGDEADAGAYEFGSGQTTNHPPGQGDPLLFSDSSVEIEKNLASNPIKCIPKNLYDPEGDKINTVTVFNVKRKGSDFDNFENLVYSFNVPRNLDDEEIIDFAGGDNNIVKSVGGVPKYVKGVSGGAYEFDGKGFFVGKGKGLDLPSTGFTLEFWLKSNGDGVVLSRDNVDDASSPYYYSYLNKNGVLEFYVYYGDGSVINEVSAGFVGDGKFHHVAFVGDGNSLRSYVDGKLIKTSKLIGNGNLGDEEIVIGGSIKVTEESFEVFLTRLEFIVML